MGARLTATAAAIALGLLALTPARAEPAMWVARDDDTTIYLVGTIHLLKPGLAWEGERTSRVLDRCDDLTLEIADFDDLAAIAPLVGKHGYEPGRRLSSLLTAEENDRLRRAAAAAGLSPDVLEPMKPWLAAVTLTMAPLQQAGFDSGAGVETRLSEGVRARGRPVRGLETAESQVMMLAGLSEAAQLEYLRDAIRESDGAPVELERMAVAWAAGETAEVDRVVNRDMARQSPGLYKAMFTDRNAAFARQIKDMMAEKGARCVAVGAGHLTGADSVQAQLKTLGVETERY